MATVVLAAAAVAFFDRRTAVSGLLPPAFRSGDSGGPSPRRVLAALLLVAVFWLSIFFPLASLGGPEPDLSTVHRAQLFLLHIVFIVTLGAWYFLGFGGYPEPQASAVQVPIGIDEPVVARVAGASGQFRRQFGLATRGVLREIGIGLAAGVGAWVGVLLVLIMLGVLIWSLGGQEALQQEPPAMVPWIAALPLGLRLGISLSAGFAEELFFRGFLQPRAGVAFSTVLFVLAHAGYGQPLMLVGVSLLSLVFAGLVKWRQSIWAAIVAHAVFDALQLLVVIPKALEFLEAGGGVS